MMWFEQRLEWWRWLIPLWHVVLESAKDRILGVDTPGQFVTHFVICLNHMVQEGHFAGQSLALQAGAFGGESVAKYGILL
jgi:hypothetical protein